MSKIAKDIPKNKEEKSGDKRKENIKDTRRGFTNVKEKISENNITKVIEPTKKREYSKTKQEINGKKNKENLNQVENLEIQELKMRDMLRKNMDNFSKSQILQHSIHNGNNTVKYPSSNKYNNKYNYNNYDVNYYVDGNIQDQQNEDIEYNYNDENQHNEDEDQHNGQDQDNEEDEDQDNEGYNEGDNEEGDNENQNNEEGDDEEGDNEEGEESRNDNRMIKNNIKFRKEKREEEIEEIEEIQEEKRKKRVEKIMKDEEINKKMNIRNEEELARKSVRIGEKKDNEEDRGELVKNDVNGEMLEIHKNYVKNLPYYYRDAITKYQSSFYLEFNALMRDGLDNKDKEHRSNYPIETELMDKLDNIIDKSPPINEILNVYRGINDRDIINSLALDGYINDMAYSSSSTNINIAKSFASSTCCLLKIIIDPKENIKYLFISKSDKNSEFEILFERGTHFVLENQSSYQGIDLYTCRIKKGIRRKVVVQEQQSISNYSDSIKNYFMDPDFISFELDYVSDPVSLFNSLKIGYPFADDIPPLIVKEILDYYEQYF